MFWMVKSCARARSSARRGARSGTAGAPRTLNCAGKPSFWMMRAYLRAASLAIASVFAPVTTCGAGHASAPQLQRTACAVRSRGSRGHAGASARCAVRWRRPPVRSPKWRTLCSHRQRRARAILPDAKMSAVVLGSRMRMMTAAKRCARERGERQRSPRRVGAWPPVARLWVVLRVARVQRDGLQVQLGVQVHRRNQVPARRRRGETRPTAQRKA